MEHTTFRHMKCILNMVNFNTTASGIQDVCATTQLFQALLNYSCLSRRVFVLWRKLCYDSTLNSTRKNSFCSSSLSHKNKFCELPSVCRMLFDQISYVHMLYRHISVICFLLKIYVHRFSKLFSNM